MAVGVEVVVVVLAVTTVVLFVVVVMVVVVGVVLLSFSSTLSFSLHGCVRIVCWVVDILLLPLSLSLF